MKNFLTILFLIVIQMTACEKSITNPNLADGDWNLVYQFQDSLTYHSLFFIDKNNGWVVGQSGKIMSTTDGGNSWDVQNSGTTERLFSVNFSDAGNGWAVGRNNAILKTTDGGANWNMVDIGLDTSMIFYKVIFTDEQHGWMISNYGKVFKTDNSGTTWNLQLNWESGGAGMMHFVDNEIGFVMPAIGNQLYKTSDGGLNWSQKSIEIDMSWERDMFFIDQSHGWVCNDRSASSILDDPASIFRTNDGGETWEEAYTFDEMYLMCIYFLDRNNGWAAGRSIYYTADGGDSWKCQLNGADTFFIDMQFIGSSTGYALDYGGALYKFKAN